MMWLIDPFLNISDALAMATRLADITTQPFGFVSGPFLADQQTRQLSLLELELGLSAAPQASLALSAFVSNLLNTAKERATVAAALAALTSAAESDLPKPLSVQLITDEGQLQSTEEVSAARSLNRRLHTSHVNTLQTLAVAPYAIWERRLAAKLALWYSVPLERRQEDPSRVRLAFVLVILYLYTILSSSC